MNRQWIKYAGIRAVKTIAQTAVATIGAAAVLSDVEWKVVASASILAGILSVLTSIAGIPEAAPVYLDDVAADELTDGLEDEDQFDDEDGDLDE